MKNLARLVAGLAAVVLGVAIFLMNVYVVSFGFYRFGIIDTSAILLIILVALIAWAFCTDNLLPDILIGVDLLFMIVSVILGSHFMLRTMSAFTLILILALIASGIGMVLSSFIGQNR